MNKYPKKYLTEDELKVVQEKNKLIIEKVKKWQCYPYVRPLCCQTEGCGEKLEPKDHKIKVILECPKCKAVQHYVPKAVLEYSFFSKVDKIEKIKGTYKPNFQFSLNKKDNE